GVNAMIATRISAAVANTGPSRRRPLSLGAHLHRQAPRLRARRCAASGLDCSVRPSTLAAMPLTARSRCNENGNSPSQKLLTQNFGPSQALRAETRTSTIPSSHATDRDPLRGRDPLRHLQYLDATNEWASVGCMLACLSRRPSITPST